MSGMRNETKLYIAIQPHINLHIKINIIVTFWHNISKLFRSLTSLYLRLSSPSRVYIPAVTFWRLQIVKTNNFQRMNWTRRISVFALFHLIRSLHWRWERVSERDAASRPQPSDYQLQVHSSEMNRECPLVYFLLCFSEIWVNMLKKSCFYRVLCWFDSTCWWLSLLLCNVMQSFSKNLQNFTFDGFQLSQDYSIN